MRERPWSFILFIIFYSLFAFILLNIFTGIMVDAIQSYERIRTETRKQRELSRVTTDGGGGGGGGDRRRSRKASEQVDLMDPLLLLKEKMMMSSPNATAAAIATANVTSKTTMTAKPLAPLKPAGAGANIILQSGELTEPTSIGTSEETLATTNTTTTSSHTSLAAQQSSVSSSQLAALNEQQMVLIAEVMQEIRKIRTEMTGIRLTAMERIAFIENQLFSNQSEA